MFRKHFRNLIKKQKNQFFDQINKNDCESENKKSGQNKKNDKEKGEREKERERYDVEQDEDDEKQDKKKKKKKKKIKKKTKNGQENHPTLYNNFKMKSNNCPQIGSFVKWESSSLLFPPCCSPDSKKNQKLPLLWLFLYFNSRKISTKKTMTTKMTTIS